MQICGLDVAMAQELLDGVDVSSSVDHGGGAGVSQPVQRVAAVRQARPGQQQSEEEPDPMGTHSATCRVHKDRAHPRGCTLPNMGQ